MTILSRAYRWKINTVASVTGATIITGETTPFYTSKSSDVTKYLIMEERPRNEVGDKATWSVSNIWGPIQQANVVYTPQAGFAAPLTNAIGNRVPKPYVSVYDYEDKFADAARADHMLLHKTLCDDIEANFPALFTKTVKAGIWSDPTVWTNGVPNASVPYACLDHDNIYDGYSTAGLEAVTVHAKWAWDSTADRLLVVDTIIGMPSARLVRGTRTSPVPESTTIGRGRFEIRYKPAGNDPGVTAARGMMWAGAIETYGAPKPQSLTCTSDPMIGDTVLHVSSGLSQYRKGDLVSVEAQCINSGSTSVDPTYTGPTSYFQVGGFAQSQGYGNDNQAWQFKKNQNELRTIVDIDVAGGTITIDAPLVYNHPTMAPTLNFRDGRLGVTRAVKPVVTNLSYSVRQIGVGDPTVLQKRAHAMYMLSTRNDMRFESYFDMARTDTNPTLTSTNSAELLHVSESDPTPIGDPLNVRGRYAVHIHGTGRNFNRPPVTLVGIAVTNTPGKPVCPGWGIVAHNSRVNMRNCTVHGVRGAAFTWEVGTEIGEAINCRALSIPGDGFVGGTGRRNANVENHNGSQGVGFELQSRAILMQGCVVKGAHAHTFSLLQGNSGFGLVRAPDNQAMKLFNPLIMGGGADVEDPYWSVDKYSQNQPQPPDWNDQLVMDCDYGFFVADRHRTYRNDLTPMIAKRFTSIGCPNPVFIENYSWHYYFYDLVCFGGVGGAVINMGAKAAHMHIARGIIEGFERVYNGGYNAYANAIDVVTSAGTDRTYCIDHEAISGGVSTPFFTIDNPSPPTLGGSAVLLSAVGGKRMTLSWRSPRTINPGPSRAGAIQFDGVMTDGAGPYSWPFIQSEDSQNFYAANSNTPQDLVTTAGCFQGSNGTWHSRLWFVTADRFPPLINGDVNPHIVHYVDIDLANDFPAGFLAANTVDPNAGRPQVPFLPEDPDKPLDPCQPPFHLSPPQIIGPLKTDNANVRALFGTPSEFPNEVDDWEMSWQVDGLEIGTARYVGSLAAHGGKTLTCMVRPVNSAGAGPWVSALYSGVIATAAPSPSTIFGSGHKETWQLDTIPKYVKPTSSGGTGLDVYGDNALVAGDGYLDGWFGKNKHYLYQGGAARPKYNKFGFRARPSLTFRGKPSDGDEGDWLTCTDLTGVTNPHLWIVFERGQQDYVIRPGCLIDFRPYFWIDLPTVGVDATQTKVGVNGGDAHLELAALPKGARVAIYVGCPTGALKFSVNNGAMQTTTKGAETSRTPFLLVGGTPSIDYPMFLANGTILGVEYVESAAALTTQQLADMQSNLNQRYSLT